MTIVALLAVTGFVYQALGERRDRRRFPMQGTLVDAGGHKLHLLCTGSGPTPVILEAPQTGLAATWWLVQEAVSRFARVCSYDRAGYGWSQSGPLPRTSRQIAGELHTLLDHAGVRPPYVMVGWSAGGYPTRVFAGLYPGDVAGMVLVDSSHPDQVARAGAPADLAEDIKRWKPVVPFIQPFGIPRLALHLEPRPPLMPPDRWEELLYLRENNYQALLQEGEAWSTSASEARAVSTIGNKPLIVLTGGRHTDANWLKVWVHGLQPELAGLSPRGRQVILANSGHGIAFDAPGAVADAIREVLSQTGR